MFQPPRIATTAFIEIVDPSNFFALLQCIPLFSKYTGVPSYPRSSLDFTLPRSTFWDFFILKISSWAKRLAFRSEGVVECPWIYDPKSPFEDLQLRTPRISILLSLRISLKYFWNVDSEYLDLVIWIVESCFIVSRWERY